MEQILYIFAAIGLGAVLWRLFRAALRAANVAIRAFFAGELVETRAHRGDVTGLAEARALAARARRERWHAIGRVGFWLAVAVLPALLLPRPAVVYSGYALLWFLPGSGRRASSSSER